MLSTWGLGKPAQSLLLPLNRGILYDYNNKVAAHNEHLQTNILEMVWVYKPFTNIHDASNLKEKWPDSFR